MVSYVINHSNETYLCYTVCFLPTTIIQHQSVY